jgi:hypothetical protein
MKKYEVVKNTREISWKKRNEIGKGCTLNQDNQYPETLESYEDKAAALEALKKYESEVYKTSGRIGTLYLVTEYYVEENEYDEDGEWIGGGDVWAFAPLPEVEE